MSTFVPPEDISIETGIIYKLEKLAENCPDYEFIAKQFLETLGGPKQVAPVMRKAAKKLRPPNPQPAMMGPGLFG